MRSKNGSVTLLLPVAIFIAVIGLCGFAADISHIALVRAQLQSATDAAALAGAFDLVSTRDKARARNSALSVAAMNYADGICVTNNSAGANITVDIEDAPGVELGTCRVTATVPVISWWSAIFGAHSHDVKTTSAAAASASVNEIAEGQCFPIIIDFYAAPSWHCIGDSVKALAFSKNVIDYLSKTVDTKALQAKGIEWIDARDPLHWTPVPGPKSGGDPPFIPGLVPVSLMNIGDSFDLFINTDGTLHSSNANLVRFEGDGLGRSASVVSVIDQLIGLPGPRVSIPSVCVGQQMSLMQDSSVLSHLADQTTRDALEKTPVVFAALTDAVPPTNDRAKVIGFIALKIKKVEVGADGHLVKLSVQLTKEPVIGRPDQQMTVNYVHGVSPSSVRLISNINQSI
jgi:hypothetical protein